jgi:hypothetical protein
MAEYYPDNHSFLTIGSDHEFTEACLSTFRYQYQNNDVYTEYCNLLGTSANDVKSIEQQIIAFWRYYPLTSNAKVRAWCIWFKNLWN